MSLSPELLRQSRELADATWRNLVAGAHDSSDGDINMTHTLVMAAVATIVCTVIASMRAEGCSEQDIDRFTDTLIMAKARGDINISGRDALGSILSPRIARDLIRK